MITWSMRVEIAGAGLYMKSDSASAWQLLVVVGPCKEPGFQMQAAA